MGDSRIGSVKILEDDSPVAIDLIVAGGRLPDYKHYPIDSARNLA
jgi:hypothetical protein